MAGIARNIELYNLAYSLAWKHISERQKRQQRDMARRLHESIRRQLKDGATDPLFIASEALEALDEERGTHWGLRELNSPPSLRSRMRFVTRAR